MKYKPEILKVLEKNGYKVFENGDFDLNIVAIRNKNTKANKFDDELLIAYKNFGHWAVESFKVTTDPGTPYLKSKKMNKKGAAVLCEGQHLGAWSLAKHRGLYLSLCQKRKPVPVYRDKNKDNTINRDKKTIDIGFHGINLHRASASSNVDTEEVNFWSAGCIVAANRFAFDRIIYLCKMQIEKHPNWENSFSITVLHENEL